MAVLPNLLHRSKSWVTEAMDVTRILSVETKYFKQLQVTLSHTIGSLQKRHWEKNANAISTKQTIWTQMKVDKPLGVNI
jgi:hypothetical protein